MCSYDTEKALLAGGIRRIACGRGGVSSGILYGHVLFLSGEEMHYEKANTFYNLSPLFGPMWFCYALTTGLWGF